MSPQFFSSWSEFQTANPASPKWDLLGQAIQKSNSLAVDYARSLGASLTYWCEVPKETHTFVNSLMYQTFLVPLRGTVRIEVAKTETLKTCAPYSVGADEELYVGRGDNRLLGPNEILAIGKDEAWRYESDDECLLIRLRVTFAGAQLRGGR